MGKLINRMPVYRVQLVERMLNLSTSLAMSTSVLKALSPSYTVTIPAMFHHDSPRFVPDDKIGVHHDALGWKKRKSSINMVSHDAPSESARYIYVSTTTDDGSATIHHGGATIALDASTIRYGASTIQAGSATVASRPPSNVHDLVVVMQQS